MRREANIQAPNGHPLAGSVGLVTGASGFIGRAVVAALPRGCEVHATYNGGADFPAWAESQAASVTPIQIDLANERVAERVPRLDWALLLAARVATAQSRLDPVGELAAAAGVAVNSVMGLDADQIVHMSSGSVYETLTGQLGPDRVLSPSLPYSIAKLTSEFLFASYADAPYWIIRFFGAFGPGEPSFKLARRLRDAFMRGESDFEIGGDGTNVIDPMYVDDAAETLVNLLTHPGESRPADLTQGEGLTVREFAETAYAALHPAAAETPLRLRFTGVAHEQMRGRAVTDTALPVPASRRSIFDGFVEYGRHRI